MTTPENKPTSKPKTDEPAPKVESTPKVATAGTVKLATPPFLSTFKVGEGDSAIVVTPKGVDLSEEDAAKVREAAKASRVKLREL